MNIEQNSWNYHIDRTFKVGFEKYKEENMLFDGQNKLFMILQYAYSSFACVSLLWNGQITLCSYSVNFSYTNEISWTLVMKLMWPHNYKTTSTICSTTFFKLKKKKKKKNNLVHGKPKYIRAMNNKINNDRHRHCTQL